jgi:serine/threonine-protein phosphatase 5
MADEPADISDEKPTAEQLKDAGNVLFKAGKFAEAVAKYDEAVDADPTVCAFYTNRAACHLKLENHGLAISDSTVAIGLDKTFVKAYFRRGSAYMALGKYKDALKDFKVARQLKPSDKDALEKFKAADKEVKREAFERAIHSDEPSKEYLADTIDVANMSVDSSYSGPRPNSPLTLEDVLAIKEHMKGQNQLHAKYVTQILVELRNQLKALPSLVDVPIPEGTRINVCGDTHGQFYDLLNIFEIKGWPSTENPYLFVRAHAARAAPSPLPPVASRRAAPRHAAPNTTPERRTAHLHRRDTALRERNGWSCAARAAAERRLCGPRLLFS